MNKNMPLKSDTSALTPTDDAKMGDLTAVYDRIAEILNDARSAVVRSVNVEMVKAYWQIGREIVEEEQRGASRAGYGDRLIEELAIKLRASFGTGFGATSLKQMRLFYKAYPNLISEIRHTVCDESEKPVVGRLDPNVSWSHYRLLSRIDPESKRSFYEIEIVRNAWSFREFERQVNSLLFERLAMSKDKKGLMALATGGHQIQSPLDIIKEPVVLEFLNLPESHRLVEGDLEEALISELQSFLLELGRGFAFLARQERLTLDGDHFYVDLVFYHVVLKCYVLVDLKTGKLTHGDLGQIQLYVNYFDQERRTEGDGPTIGLVLCADKNDAVVRYTLGEGNQQIFASRYKLYLPSEEELAAEIRRELQDLGAND